MTKKSTITVLIKAAKQVDSWMQQHAEITTRRFGENAARPIRLVVEPLTKALRVAEDERAAARQLGGVPSYAALVNLFRIAATKKAANKPHDPKDPAANAHLQEYFVISDQYDDALALCEREAAKEAERGE